MPGNEVSLAIYLIQNKHKISLRHLGIVKSVGAPTSHEDKYVEMQNSSDACRCLATEDSRKKADIYINGYGVSVKQLGASFAYNRLQRANLAEIFALLGFNNRDSVLQTLDSEVENFHRGNLDRRNRPWEDFFNESEFKTLMKFLMINGSPNVGFSSHPAEFILEATASNISTGNIYIYTFDEYFDKYVGNFKIAIRRQWIGQDSDSEHNRALSLARKAENAPWVFDDVAGTPRTGWRIGFPASERKTVYFLMLEKER